MLQFRIIRQLADQGIKQRIGFHQKYAYCLQKTFPGPGAFLCVVIPGVDFFVHQLAEPGYQIGVSGCIIMQKLSHFRRVHACLMVRFIFCEHPFDPVSG